MVNFVEAFGLLFLTVVCVSLITKLLRQPIIIGYVVSGITFALFFGRANFASEQTVLLSELGITFLLFLMGMEFDLKSLKYLGKDIFILTLAQSVLFFGLAFGIASIFSFTLVENVYISILFMFSSTLLVANLLEEKKETGSLSGKIILGMLVMQDFFAIIILTLLSVFQEKSLVGVVLVPLKGILLIVIAVVVSRYLLSRLLGFSSRYPELLYIVSLGICFFFVEIAPRLGYSTTIGAFIGGVAIANTLYKIEILSRLKPLVAFFNMLFFVSLGFQMDFVIGSNFMYLVAILCVVAIIIKPIIGYFSFRLRGYDIRTSFSVGIYLAQLSEFGIIIVSAGMAYGAVRTLFGSIAIISVIATMIVSSYLIKYEDTLYRLVTPILKKIERHALPTKSAAFLKDLDYQIVLFGYYDISKDLFARFSQLGKKIVVIEHDPERIELLKKEKIEFIYNSVHNPEFFEHLQFKNVELVISSLQRVEENETLIKELRSYNPKLIAIVTARSSRDALELYNRGADYVIYSEYLNEQQVSVLLEDYTTDINQVLTKKIMHIAQLKDKERKRSLDARKTLLWDIDAAISGKP